jgi:hypothetical protein
LTAFFLSVCFGVLGADQYYLGYPYIALVKLLTLGGGGLWYLYDICRIGSSTVPTKHNFRLAADLPHFAFVLSVVTVALFLGFVVSMFSIMSHRRKKSHEIMMMRGEADNGESMFEDWKFDPTKKAKQEQPQEEQAPLMQPFVPFSGYGTTLPPTLPPPVPSAILEQTIPKDDSDELYVNAAITQSIVKQRSDALGVPYSPSFQRSSDGSSDVSEDSSNSYWN